MTDCTAKEKKKEHKRHQIQGEHFIVSVFFLLTFIQSVVNSFDFRFDSILSEIIE